MCVFVRLYVYVYVYVYVCVFVCAWGGGWVGVGGELADFMKRPRERYTVRGDVTGLTAWLAAVMLMHACPAM